MSYVDKYLRNTLNNAYNNYASADAQVAIVDSAGFVTVSGLGFRGHVSAPEWVCTECYADSATRSSIAAASR